MQIKIIDSTRFMASSLSNLVDNDAEGIHDINCKFGHYDKKCKTCRFNKKIVSAVLNTQAPKNTNRMQILTLK